MSHPEEHSLVQQAMQGDQDAFADLMRQYEKPIYNLCLRMVRKPEDAEELTQTSFFKAWRALPGFQEESGFFTWLYRLTKNTCIDFLRRETRRHNTVQTVSLDADEDAALQLPDLRQLPEERAMQHDRQRALLRALESLAPEHRNILIHRELDGLSYQEIATLCHLELGTVKSRIARARIQLRQLLLHEGNFFSHDSSDQVKASDGGDL